MRVEPGLAFFLLAIVGVAVFLVVMLPVVAVVNRAIGSRYDERAVAIAPYLQAEGLRFAEDDVRVRTGWLAPLAAAVRWNRADVRVTTRAIYLLQHARMFGMRIGQPILAFPLRGAILEPAVAGAVSAGWLSTYPQGGSEGVVLAGGLGVQRFSMRLSLRDAAGFLAATS